MNEFYSLPGVPDSVLPRARNRMLFSWFRRNGILAALFLLFCLGTKAQPVMVPAGNPAGVGDYQPISPWFYYMASDVIYLASEIGTTGTITSVGFYLDSRQAATLRNVPFTIKMKTTTATSLPTASRNYNTFSSSATTVWSGTITDAMLQAGNWVNITLTTPFNYTGNNLEVFTNAAAASGSQESETSRQFRWSSVTGSSRTIVWERDDAATLNNNYATNLNFIPNIQFLFGSCGLPTALGVTGVTASGATANWTAPSSAPSNGYNYEVRTSGSAGSGASGLAQSGSTAAGVTTKALSGLAAGTTYKVYVQSNCGGTSRSLWTAGATFTTSCLTQTSLPHVESFDNPILNCWTSTVVSGAAWKPAPNNDSADNPHSGANFLSLDWTGTAQNSFVFSPQYNLSAFGTLQARVNLWIYRNSEGIAGDVVYVGVNTSASPTGAVALLTVPLLTTSAPAVTSEGWYNYTVDIPTSYNAAPFYVVIRGTVGASGSAYSVGVDDYRLEWTPPAITSFAPSTVCSADLAGTNVTLTGTNLSNVTAVALNGESTPFTLVDATHIQVHLQASSDPGTFTLTATNGNATSPTALAVVNNPVVDPIAGGNATVCLGDSVSLTDASPGGSWGSSNTLVAQVDEFGTVTTLSAGTANILYTVTDNGCSTAVSTPITVNAPVSSSDPAAQTVLTGSNATFSVTATGDVTGYQWQVSTDGGDVFTNVPETAPYSGTTTSTLNITGATGDLSESLYRVIVFANSPCPDYESAAALLLVGDTGIETQPQNVTLCSSGAGIAQFTVVASGDVDTYTWEENAGLGAVPITDGTFGGITYSGATTSQLTVSGVGLSETGRAYHVIVTGSANSATSNDAILTVNENVSIGTQPQTQSVCSTGGNASFSVVASGNISGYQWQYSSDNGSSFNNVANNTPTGITYSNATSPTLGIAVANTVSASGNYLYRVVINGVSPCGNLDSDTVQLQISQPSITANPAPASVLAGQPTTFSVASADGAATFAWEYATAAAGPFAPVTSGTPAGVTYSGTTSSTLTVNTNGTTPTGSAYYYRAVVTSGGCARNSNSGQMTVTNYCTPSTTNVNTYMTAFSTSGGMTNIINPSAGLSAGGYGNFSNLSASQVQGLPVNFTSTLSGVGTGIGGAIWIDWDHDGTFDTTERVFVTTAAVTSFSGSFSVPSNALPGPTRMRVMVDFNVNSPVNPCIGPAGRRETEDYTFNVIESLPCTGTPLAGTVTSAANTLCLSGSTTLTASGYSVGATGIGLQWYSTTNGLISGATNPTYTTPVLTSTDSYFLRVTCAGSGLFADSNTATVTVANPAVTSTSPGVRCGAGTVNLSATSSAGTTLNWYSALTGGTLLASGNSFTTPSISGTTNYFVSAEALGNGSAAIGTGNTSGVDAAYNFANGLYGGMKTQFLLTAAELRNAGIRPGNLTGLSFEFTSAGSTLQGFTVQVGASGLTEFPSSADIVGGLTTVVNNISFIPTVGVNSLAFSSPFNWDGTSNVIVSVSWSNNNTSNSDSTIRYNSTSNRSSQSYRRDSVTAATMLAFTGSTGSGTYTFDVSSSRPKITFQASSVAICTSSPRVAVAATVNTPPALALSSTSVAICAGTPSAAITLTSNPADYDSYVWSPSAGVSGNAASGFVFNPASTTVYTLYATQSGGSLCTNSLTFTVNVDALPAVISASPAATTVCAGDNAVALTVGNQSGSIVVGTGTAVNASNTLAAAYPVPYGAFYENAKQQYLIRASELTALGLVAGSALSSIGFTVTNVNGSGIHKQYTISIGTTSQSSLATFETGLTTVFGPVNYQPVLGVNTHTFSTPYTWDGTSNIVVQICHTNDNAGGGTNYTQNALVRYSTTSFNSSITYRVDDTDACGLDSTTFTEAERPNMTFAYSNGNVTWSPTAGLFTDATATTAYTGGIATTVYAKPASTATYTATITSSGNCTRTSSASITVNQYYDFYVDADGDHYGTGSPVSFCAASATSPPAGYASVAGDCNDALAAVNPGQAEVAFNGVDDDCDGTIDEGSQIYSQVLASQCGTTLTSISSLIGAVSFGAPVDGYRFEVTNMQTNAVQVIDRNVPNFSMTMLASYDYATTYSIRVMLRRNNIWLNYYGNPCLVSTPAVLDPGGAAAVNPSQCGIVLPSISTLIATTSLPGVTAYRFRVTNLTDSAEPFVQQIIERNYHWFALTMLTRFNYGTEYQVEVAVKTSNGTWSGFGAPCNVSAPAVPTIANCGATIAGTGTYVSTSSLNRAQAYRFEITNMSSFEQTIVDRSQNWFTFTNVPNYAPGTVYSVRVAIQTSGYWSPFGEACEITSPGAARNVVKDEPSQPEIKFRAVVYPNPYTESFALDMDTSSEDRIQVKVYDMIGKLIEEREFAIDAVEMQQFGERYPSGVYNLVVTQAGFVKTLRAIKR